MLSLLLEDIEVRLPAELDCSKESKFNMIGKINEEIALPTMDKLAAEVPHIISRCE